MGLQKLFSTISHLYLHSIALKFQVNVIPSKDHVILHDALTIPFQWLPCLPQKTQMLLVLHLYPISSRDLPDHLQRGEGYKVYECHGDNSLSPILPADEIQSNFVIGAGYWSGCLHFDAPLKPVLLHETFLLSVVSALLSYLSYPYFPGWPSIRGSHRPTNIEWIIQSSCLILVQYRNIGELFQLFESSPDQWHNNTKSGPNNFYPWASINITAIAHRTVLCSKTTLKHHSQYIITQYEVSFICALQVML